MKVLFIHRSVGAHLMQYGHLRERSHKLGIQLDDYDNNNGRLTHSNTTFEANAIQMPHNNTNPKDLAEFFKQWPELLNKYDIIMIKSCYPNSHVANKQVLRDIQQDYRQIINAFNQHNKKLVIITMPPLRPLFTNKIEAKNAGDLALWLTRQATNQVKVFDLHTLYAEETGKHAGMLKRSYRRILPWDNHPVATAHRLTAPRLAELLRDFNADNYKEIGV